MLKAARQFLLALLSTPSPSGHEAAVARLWLDYVQPFADEVETDAYGNAFALVHGRGGGGAGIPARQKSGKGSRQNAKPTISPSIGGQECPPHQEGARATGTLVMFEGHSDEIGLMVTYIDDEGFLWVDRIGGVDPKMMLGKRVVVHSAGGPVPGVLGTLAPHMQTGELREKSAQVNDLYVDIGAPGKAAAQLKVRVGDPLTVDHAPVMLLGDTLAARSCDNKIGIWCAAEGLRRYRELGGAASVVAAAHVQEEIGLHGAQMGAFRWKPDVSLTVDVCNATDFPDADKKLRNEIKLGAGPAIRIGPAAHPKVNARLEEVAAQRKIPLQRVPIPTRSGTNANAIYPTRGGIPAGILSTPNRYMHSPSETVNLADLDQIPTLMAHFAASLKAGEWFKVHG